MVKLSFDFYINCAFVLCYTKYPILFGKGAIKTGSLFVLYLGVTSIEHADWKKKLCKKVSAKARCCALLLVYKIE